METAQHPRQSTSTREPTVLRCGIGCTYFQAQSATREYSDSPCPRTKFEVFAKPRRTAPSGLRNSQGIDMDHSIRGNKESRSLLRSRNMSRGGCRCRNSRKQGRRNVIAQMPLPQQLALGTLQRRTPQRTHRYARTAGGWMYECMAILRQDDQLH